MNGLGKLMMTFGLAAWLGLLHNQTRAAETETLSTGQELDTFGVIQALFLETREANISGYRYQFSDFGNDVAEVKILGFSTGSFELLAPGMKVWVVFKEVSDGRQVFYLEQIPQSEEVAH